ncbi:hypothetical protein ACP70R_024707 [Stipagrostis hirtigluma subsp. patula]
MIATMVAGLVAVTIFTLVMGMPGAVIVMPTMGIPLVVITLVLIVMEVQIATGNVVIVQLEEEAAIRPGLEWLTISSSYRIQTMMFIDHSTFLLFDADGSIPLGRLHNHKHAIICLALLVYAGAALHLDRVWARCRHELGLLLIVVVFAQELLMFHFHSTDHAGVEGQFHWLLQLVVAACLTTALLGVGFPRSFAVLAWPGRRASRSTRCGSWSLEPDSGPVWVPSRVPKGCSLVEEDGRGHVALP